MTQEEVTCIRIGTVRTELLKVDPGHPVRFKDGTSTQDMIATFRRLLQDGALDDVYITCTISGKNASIQYPLTEETITDGRRSSKELRPGQLITVGRGGSPQVTQLCRDTYYLTHVPREHLTNQNNTVTVNAIDLIPCQSQKPAIKHDSGDEPAQDLRKETSSNHLKSHEDNLPHVNQTVSPSSLEAPNLSIPQFKRIDLSESQIHEFLQSMKPSCTRM